jgi:hypothetical protein
VSSPVYRRPPSVLWRNSADRVVILPPRSGHPVTIDGPGQALWSLLAEPQSVASMINALAVQYAVDQAVVAEALDPLLAELVELGALEPAVDPA